MCAFLILTEDIFSINGEAFARSLLLLCWRELHSKSIARCGHGRCSTSSSSNSSSGRGTFTLSYHTIRPTLTASILYANSTPPSPYSRAEYKTDSFHENVRMQFAQVDFERQDEDIKQNVTDEVKKTFKMFAAEIDTAPEQNKPALRSLLGASAAVDIFR